MSRFLFLICKASDEYGNENLDHRMLKKKTKLKKFATKIDKKIQLEN